MRSVRFFLLLLMFLLSQCQWSWNKNSSPVLNPPSSDEKLDSFFCVPDSLIEELPVLPDDYFMTESNIMREEGYELEPQKALAILQQKKGRIIPTSYDTFVFKRSEGKIRVFLSGKWPVSENVCYYILKCFAEGGSVEVFLFSVTGKIVRASEWIASVDNDSDCGIGLNCNEDGDFFIPGQIMSRRQGDTVLVYSYDTHEKLTEEYRCFMRKDGKLLNRRTNKRKE